MKNNNSIEIKYGEENKITDKWFHGKPLKVITHGWRGTPLSMVFNVRTGEYKLLYCILLNLVLVSVLKLNLGELYI